MPSVYDPTIDTPSSQGPNPYRDPNLGGGPLGPTGTQQSSTSAGLGNQNYSQKGTLSGNQSTTGTLGQQQQNQYGAGQQALQQQLPGTLSNFLQTGNLPGTFAAPPQVLSAYQSNFNQMVAPQLAAQYGAGSPVLGSQETMGLQQLLSNLYQTQSNNFNNDLNTGANIAFNAIGSNANTQQAQQQAQTQNTNTTGNQNWQQLNSLSSSMNPIGQ
jgi:hypothetical protein